MKIIAVKARSGLKIRNPKDGQPLPCDRTTRIELDQFWMRRLNAGDIIEVQDEAPKKVLKRSRKKAAEKPEDLGEQNAD